MICAYCSVHIHLKHVITLSIESHYRAWTIVNARHTISKFPTPIDLSASISNVIYSVVIAMLNCNHMNFESMTFQPCDIRITSSRLPLGKWYKFHTGEKKQNTPKVKKWTFPGMEFIIYFGNFGYVLYSLDSKVYLFRYFIIQSLSPNRGDSGMMT